MKPFSWILLGLCAIFAGILLAASVAVHGTKQSIQDVDTQTYRNVIDTSLASHNSNIIASDLTFKTTQYVEDSIAVVKAATESGTVVTFVFEYYNGTLFLTNYTSGLFADGDFNDTNLTPFIVNAASQS